MENGVGGGEFSIIVLNQPLCLSEEASFTRYENQKRKLKFTNIMTKGIYVIIIVAFLSMGNKVEPRFSYSTKKRLCVCLLF